MLLLALDTSGAGVGVAVHDGTSVLAEASVPGAQKHAEQLMPAVVAALAAAGVARSALTDLAVGVGPGPFTGLRVGLVTAQVLGRTLGLPVHGVCSLDAIAEAVADVVSAPVGGAGSESFLVATDARRREVYWAAYELTTGPWPWRRVEGPFVAVPAEVPVVGPDGVRRRVVGRGVELYPDLLGGAVGAAVDRGQVAAVDGGGVSAGALAAVAFRALLRGESTVEGRLVEPRPWYLRRPDAVPAHTRKRVLQ